MKTINQIQEDLQAICPDFTVMENPNNELAGVYWKGHYANIAMPKAGVYEFKSEGYTDPLGKPHRSYSEIIERANQFLIDIERPEYVELITT